MSNIIFKPEYVSYLPKEGNSPKLTISGDTNEEFLVQFIDGDNLDIIYQGLCTTNNTIIGQRQWYTNWIIRVYNKDKVLCYVDYFNPTGKVIFIKCDSFALGDNIAWIPYFDEFRKKHNCTVICSTFFNDLFESEYPHLLFVKPNTIISNVYAQFYVGASDDGNIKYCPRDYKNIRLQDIPCDILGLNFRELKPNVKISNTPLSKKPYICISEYASGEDKMWGYKNGWQLVVDYVNGLGYEVHVISKESTSLNNIIDLTGNISLHNRISELNGAKIFMGVSSGLAWLSWAVGTHVVMISDISPESHEFQTNITRFSSNTKGFVDYGKVEPTSCEKVLKELGRILS
jgi:autotransporter strand-loop-strand O-heptosyltransferase